MKKYSDLVKSLTLLTQFGLSLITPLLLCLFISYLLCEKAGLGPWVYLAGFFFGLGGSGTFAWKFFQMTEKQEEKRELMDAKDQKKKRKDTISFNDHI